MPASRAVPQIDLKYATMRAGSAWTGQRMATLSRLRARLLLVLRLPRARP